MRTVWKVPINFRDGDNPVLNLPRGSRFLKAKNREYDDSGAQVDTRAVMVIDTWWAVETDNDPVEHQLYIRGTGSEMPASANYLDTVFFMLVSEFVLHIWQKEDVFQEMTIEDGKFVPKPAI